MKCNDLNTDIYPDVINSSEDSNRRTAEAYVSRWWRGERLVHAALDRQFDVVGVHAGLLGVCGVDFGVLDDGRHISCEQKQQRSDWMLKLSEI